MATWKVFKAWMFFEAEDTALSDEADWDDKPVKSIGPGADAGVAGAGITSPSHIRRGILDFVGWRINVTNATTYRLTLFDDRTGADQSYQIRARCIFDSDEVVAACADDIAYWALDLARPFALEDVGDFFYNLDHTGDPGNCTGYVILRGRYEALDPGK